MHAVAGAQCNQAAGDTVCRGKSWKDWLFWTTEQSQAVDDALAAWKHEMFAEPCLELQQAIIKTSPQT